MIYKIKKSDIFWTIILLIPTVLSLYIPEDLVHFMYIMLFGGAFSFFRLIHYDIFPFKFRLYEFIFPVAWSYLFIVFVKISFEYIENKLQQFNNNLDNNSN